MKSPPIDGDSKDSGTDNFIDNTVGKCTVLDMRIMNINILYLLDTGSQVSTVTESYYREFIEPLGTHLNTMCKIGLKAANGIEIPYI